ncbi:MAG: Mbeg1-like protein [Thermoguttaceae bacterium]
MKHQSSSQDTSSSRSSNKEDVPYLDFMEYRCALVCQKLNDSSKNIEQYDIYPAVGKQKDQIFGMTHIPLFQKGINNIRFELFQDRKMDRFILAFHGTQSLLDWIDNIQQLFGQEAELYKQVRAIAEHVCPAFRKKILLTGHSLGGGLATVAALVLGSPAIVFNPPRIHRNTISGLSQDDVSITRYRVKGDIASSKIPWTTQHVELGREICLTTIPFSPPHSMGQVLAGLKNNLSFQVFLIDSIVEMLQPRVPLKGDALRQLVFVLVQGKPFLPKTLPDLLGIEYHVEKVNADWCKIIISVVYRKDRTSAELIKQETDWKWEDMHEDFRKEFILSKQQSSVYTIYKQG